MAGELLKAALTDAGADNRMRAEIEVELTGVSTNLGQFARARNHAESAVTAAERLGDPDLIANTLGHLLATFLCTGMPPPRGGLERLMAMGDPTTMTTYHQPSTAIGMAFFWAGDFDAARPLLEAAAIRALSRGEEWDRLGVLLILARLEWDAGNQMLAKQHRDSAEEALGEFSEALLWLIDFDARCALDSGDLTTARAKADHGLSLADAAASVMFASRLLDVVASIELLSGQPELAHARLKGLRQSFVSRGWGPAGYTRTSLWSDDVEALLTMNRLQEAEEVVAELQARAEVMATSHARAVAARCEGMLLAARGDLVSAVAAMDTALDAHGLAPRPLEQGRTLLEKGSIERRAKRKAAAKRTLEEALNILEPLGAEYWVARARDELSRIGLRRAKSTDGLTPAEARVAERVAAGLTNPEIARELHMGLRTVESHLSRVYRQYGVSSRSQLVAALVASNGRPSAAHIQ